MTESITVALITGFTLLIGNVIVALIQSSKTKYQVEQLEKKVEKHNNLIERMYACEDRLNLHDEKIAVANHRIDDLESQK